MFEVENLNEFINKMFTNAIKSRSDVKEGIVTFRKYLKETSMCDDEYLRILDKIIECSHELLELKKKMNNLDVVFFVEHTLNEQTQQNNKKSTKRLVKTFVLDNCGSSGYSSSCGTSSSSSDRCGGGGYTSRC